MSTNNELAVHENVWQDITPLLIMEELVSCRHYWCETGPDYYGKKEYGVFYLRKGDTWYLWTYGDSVKYKPKRILYRAYTLPKSTLPSLSLHNAYMYTECGLKIPDAYDVEGNICDERTLAIRRNEM